MAGMQVLGTSYGLLISLGSVCCWRKEEMESACLCRQENQNEKMICRIYSFSLKMTNNRDPPQQPRIKGAPQRFAVRRI